MEIKTKIAVSLKKLGACSPSIEWSKRFGGDYKAFYEAIPRGDWVLWYLAAIGAPKHKVGAAIAACTRYILDSAKECNCAALEQSLIDLEKWDGSKQFLDKLEKDRLNVSNEFIKPELLRDSLLAHVLTSIYYTLEYATTRTSPIDAMEELYDAATFVDAKEDGCCDFMEHVVEKTASIVKIIVPWTEIKKLTDLA